MRIRHVTVVLKSAIAGTLALMTASGALAQTAMATVTGTAVDETQAVMPGVTITVVDLATHATREAVSNDDGFFSLPARTSALTECPRASNCSISGRPI